MLCEDKKNLTEQKQVYLKVETRKIEAVIFT